MSETKLLVGHKIKAFREMKGISQEYLAGKIGMSQNNLSKIEKGDIKVSFERLCEIADFLEADINSIINFDAKNFFNHCNQFGIYNTTIHSEDKHVQDLIETKNELIEGLKKQIALLEKLTKQ